ncbi:hypothetical protein DES53_111125 [Roseimicrobium gellanilyticum]|uniref:Uncharacterized protein n=1 Tax=Roseimicrobium gellanilyticum TaxID=748857 RepID=A0A366HA94_9BACT|nr:hypothetical protein [Roseimicrobium gellanilyticum]RBP38606.1 hypothetical protein DES53_111125 [Roseimicrobium gellanilyticum]
MNDEKLNQMLHSWKVEAELPPSFQRDVWRKIETAQANTSVFANWLTSFLNWLAKPLPAVATCALTLGAGLVVGGLVGRDQSVSKPAAYAYSIDPLAQLSNP